MYSPKPESLKPKDDKENKSYVYALFYGYLLSKSTAILLQFSFGYPGIKSTNI